MSTPTSDPKTDAEILAEGGDVDQVAAETARKAQRVVAAYAQDADECRMLLSMLGIGPEEPEEE